MAITDKARALLEHRGQRTRPVDPWHIRRYTSAHEERLLSTKRLAVSRDPDAVIHIGTSGFDYDDWVGYFYPDGLPKASRLAYYAEHFGALELNFSYYRMPTAKSLERMVERTSGKVVFALKAHSSMTHERTAGDLEIAAFHEALSPLREAGVLVAVLAQFPHSFHQTEQNRAYLSRLSGALGPPLVAELRDADWATPPILAFLAQLGLGFTCVDEPPLPGLMPPIAPVTAAPAYVRFHGRNAAKWYAHDLPHERYDYRYSPSELSQWKPKIESLEAKAGQTLVFFNNHFQGKAVDSAQAMMRLLGIP